MTAEEARNYETNCTLISDADKAQYEKLMTKVSDTISGPDENVRKFTWRNGIARRVQNKLRQDHFQLTFMSDGAIEVSWEPLNTES